MEWDRFLNLKYQYVKYLHLKYQMSEITAKVKTPTGDRISQCDIFQDVEVVEEIKLTGATMELKTITFPYIICLESFFIYST